MKKTFSALLGLLLLSGCVSSQVTTFYDENLMGMGFTYTIEPKGEQKNSLEYKEYAKLVSAELDKKGFIAQDAKSDYKVSFDYGIDSGKSIVVVERHGASTETTYNSFFKLDISDRKTGAKVYEATVKNEGHSASFSGVSKCLIEALFKNYPGKNGKTETVNASYGCMEMKSAFSME